MNETKKLMTTNVVTVKSDTPIDRALELLIEKNITGLPVVDDDRTLIGIISEKDMLKLLPGLEDESAAIVADFMTKDITCFDQE